MQTYSGRFHDGRSARTLAVRVELSALTLAIVDADGAERARWPLAEIRQSAAAARAPGLRLQRGGGDAARLVLDDPAAIAAIAAACPELSHRPPGIARDWRPLLLWGTLALGGLALALFVLLPLTAQSLARAIPIEAEQRLGAGLARQVIDSLASRQGGAERVVCLAPAGRRAVERLVARLAPPGVADRIAITVVDLPQVNALTLPGGQLLLFRGLIDFAEGPEEIAGALAHELGHVVHRHTLELVIQSAGTAALIGLLVGDVTGGTVIAGLGQLLLQASYRREAEREADAFASERLAAAGIDGAAFAALFDRLEARHPAAAGAFSIFLTHPVSPERSAVIRAAAVPGGPALSPQEWRDLQRICEK